MRITQCYIAEVIQIVNLHQPVFVRSQSFNFSQHRRNFFLKNLSRSELDIWLHFTPGARHLMNFHIIEIFEKYEIGQRILFKIVAIVLQF